MLYGALHIWPFMLQQLHRECCYNGILYIHKIYSLVLLWYLYIFFSIQLCINIHVCILWSKLGWKSFACEVDFYNFVFSLIKINLIWNPFVFYYIEQVNMIFEIPFCYFWKRIIFRISNFPKVKDIHVLYYQEYVYYMNVFIQNSFSKIIIYISHYFPFIYYN